MPALSHFVGRPLLVSLLLSIPAFAQEPAEDEKLRAEVKTCLTDFHASAAAANAEGHLACIREDAIILGSGPGERFDYGQYRALVQSAFASGRGWKTVPYLQNVVVSTDGGTAWFDERLHRSNGMEFRTTGVLRRGTDGWKFVLINNTFPVPNEHALELAAKIREVLNKPSRSIPDDSGPAKLLREFHRAGAEADLERYLGFLAEDSVSLGTDVDESRTRAEVREWLASLFAIGQGLDTELVVLHVTQGEEGRFAWFDARLDKPSLCELRGSGLLRRDDDGWKIVHYVRAFVVPNELIKFIANKSAFTTPLEVTVLREEFVRLRKTLEAWHPALYVYETKEDMDRLFEEKMARIDAPMTPLDFETLIGPVIARVHCVHTRILPTDLHYVARLHASTYLPVEPQVIDGRLYIRTNYVDDPAALDRAVLTPGAEILEINGLTAQKVIARLLGVVSSDGRNQSHKLAVLNDGFNLLYATHLGSPKKFDLRVRKRGAVDVQELSAAALNFGQWNAGVETRGPARQPKSGGDLETEILPDEDVAILTHPGFSPIRPVRFTKELKEFFARLDEKDIGNLIVDLRHNTGGVPDQGTLLLSYLADEPFTYLWIDPEKNSLVDALYLYKFTRPRSPAEHYFKGRIFVLIGGRNTSTAGHVISHLKQQGRVILIGQESGATYICNDNSKDLNLPATGLRVHIARTTFQAAVSGLRPDVGVKPDHEVHRTVEDMLTGRDVEMELARRLAREGG